MQDRYVGDIGDYAKYSLLNALAEGQKLGVAWYKFPNEMHNSDGKHVSYLDNPEEWADRDSTVFNSLNEIVKNKGRSLYAVQKAGFLNCTTFADEILSHQSNDSRMRATWRKSWFQRVRKQLSECSLVFADPDNGLCLDASYKFGTRKMWKRIPQSEVNILSRDRSAIVYHHNTRRKGGHEAEIDYWMAQIKADIAIRVRYGTSRTFFVLNSTPSLRRSVDNWAASFSRGTSKIQVHKKP